MYASHYATSGAIYRIIWKDSDSDGLPDDWEQQYFGSPTGAVANADPDGDGFTNLQEFLAGTDPTNANDALRITAITPSGPDYIISFASVFGRTYELDQTTNLVSSSWTPIVTNIPGTGGIVPVTDSGAAAFPERFYRIRLGP